MPFNTIAGAKEAQFPTKINDISLTLEQVNKLAEMYDALKKDSKVDNPMAIAITNFKKMYKKEGNKYVRVKQKEMAIKTTSEVNGHTHTYDDTKSGKTSLNNGHIHEYIVEDEKIIIKNADGHTHAPAKQAAFKETYNIDNKEIFAVGTYNGTKVTHQDLEDMVAAFKELKGHRDVPLKLGHTNNQKFLQSDGLPAAGWIDSLKKVGDKLICSIKEIPKKVKELIDSGAYKKVSSEILLNWIDGSNGQKYRRVLSGVALLGAEIPAVSGLNDFGKFYNETDNYEEIINVNYSLLSNKISGEKDKAGNDTKDNKGELQHIKEERKMELEEKYSELKVTNEVLEKEKKDLEKKTQDFASRESNLIAEKKELEEKLNKQKLDKKTSEIKIFVDENSVKDNMKILPKHKSLVTALLSSIDDSSEVKFSENEVEQTINIFEGLKKFISELSNVVNFDETGTNPAKDKKPKNAHELIKKIATEKKIPYEEAMVFAEQENPEMFKSKEEEGGNE
jgi:hypothetical protein